MDPVWLLLLLPVAAASGWYAARQRQRQHKRVEPGALPAQVAYFRSLNFLLNEQHDKALDVLINALEDHEETTEIQLALGSLFRRRGEIERATQIHQSLIARTGLDSQQRTLALFELANDYYKAGLLDRAENLLLEVAGVGELAEPAMRLLIQIYEQEKEWHSAIQVGQKLGAVTGEGLDSVIAHYHCELAEVQVGAGDYSSAQKHAQAALDLDRDCARATILDGRLEALAGRHGEAVRAWSRIGRQRPEMLGEVLHLVESSYRSMENPDAFRGFLEQAIQRSDDVRLVLALADQLGAIRASPEAERVLLERLQGSVTLSGLHRLLELRASDENSDVGQDEYGMLARLTGALAAQESGYECRCCGFRGKAMHWQCPGCRNWNTTLPRHPAPTLTHGDTFTK